MPQAEALYRQVVAADPRHVDSTHFLGVIAAQQRRFDEAEDWFRKTLALRPELADVHNNLGNVLSDLGRVREAIDCYRKASELDSRAPDPWYNLGNALRDAGQVKDAIAAFRRVLSLMGNHYSAMFNLASVLSDNGELDEAIGLFQRILSVNPAFPGAHNNLGTALTRRGRHEEAVTNYRKAIALKPDSAEAHNNLGNALKAQHKLQEAADCYRKALALRPGYPEAWYNLGDTLAEPENFEQAVEAYGKAIALRPDYNDAHNNLGNAVKNQGRFEEAFACYRKALAIDPEFPEAHNNLAQMLLLHGDYEAGWKEQEWRWRWKEFPSPRRDLKQPQWRGEDLAGRTILVHAEQGMGDVIQFSRFVPMVAERGGNVIVECAAALYRLLRSIPGVKQWVVAGDSLPDFDMHCPMQSLPLALGITLENLPNRVPYLSVDQRAIERWRKKLSNDAVGQSAGLRVGVAWAGNPAHRNDRNRSIPASMFLPLSTIAGVSLYSLQKGDARVIDIPAALGLIDHTHDLADYADTAALIMNLDLVISVDTSIIHLAGALARPAWVMVPFIPDWRWLLAREDSPWYPTIRIFRQTHRGDWCGLIDRVTRALHAIALSRTATG